MPLTYAAAAGAAYQKSPLLLVSAAGKVDSGVMPASAWYSLPAKPPPSEVIVPDSGTEAASEAAADTRVHDSRSRTVVDASAANTSGWLVDAPTTGAPGANTAGVIVRCVVESNSVYVDEPMNLPFCRSPRLPVVP